MVFETRLKKYVSKPKPAITQCCEVKDFHNDAIIKNFKTFLSQSFNKEPL